MQLRITADIEASWKEKMDMLVNQKRYREMCFLLPDVSTGKGKLRSMKKAMLLLCVLGFHLCFEFGQHYIK